MNSNDNHRRLDLITKKYSDGITEAEDKELAELQTQMDEYLERVCPRDTVLLDRPTKARRWPYY